MEIDKETVAGKLRANGDHDRAQQAVVSLPRHVETSRDANLLRALDVDIGELERDQVAASERTRTD